MSEDVQGTKMQILSIVDDYDSDKRGITSSQLKQRLNLDKSTVSYHTGKLEDKLLLTSIKIGRTKYFDLSPKARELLESEDVDEEIVAQCGNCGKSHASFEDAKKCCVEKLEEKEVKASK